MEAGSCRTFQEAKDDGGNGSETWERSGHRRSRYCKYTKNTKKVSNTLQAFQRALPNKTIVLRNNLAEKWCGDQVFVVRLTRLHADKP